MKKALSVVVAVLLIAISVIPAFASDYDSPGASKANYIIYIDTDVEGGTITYHYSTEVGEDGKQTIVVVATPDEGYDFGSWIIDGEYVPAGSLTDEQLELVISGDIKLSANFNKTGEPATQAPEKQEKIVDDGSKSPKTGANAFAPVAVLIVSAAALVAVVAAKRRSEK